MKRDIIENITLINGDCIEYMRTLPDKAFSLAIVDPPYGDGGGSTTVSADGSTVIKKKKNPISEGAGLGRRNTERAS